MARKTEVAEVMADNGYDTAEAWARGFEQAVRPYLAKHGYTLPEKIRYGFAFGSKGRRGRIKGECWPKEASDDGAVEIFIRCDVDDPVEVAGVILHEYGHACPEGDPRHSQKFRDYCLKIGLNAEDGLLHAKPGRVLLAEIVEPALRELGPLPRKKLNFDLYTPDGEKIVPADKAKKQTTRNRKAFCADPTGCGYTLLITSRWIEASDYGPPVCPKHGKPLYVEPKKEAEEGDPELPLEPPVMEPLPPDDLEEAAE